MSATVLQGDCRDLMRSMPDASVDSIVTDPPYDLTSIVKRFGKPGAAPQQFGTDGAFARAARGFMGQTWDGTGVAFDPATWAEALRVLKPGGYLLAFGGSRTYHRMACAIEDAGFELRDQIMWIYGSGFPKSHNLEGEHGGWGTALKPAHEPIAVARKPLAGTVAANMAAYGVGAMHIDACRVDAGGPSPSAAYRAAGRAPASCRPGEYGDGYTIQNRISPERWLEARAGEQLGRWPANVVHDGSDEVEAAFPAAPGQQGDLRAHSRCRQSPNGIFGGMRPALDHAARGDVGTAARFFYCAKASKADREEGCDSLDLKPAGQVSETSGQHITRREEGYEPPQRRNPHPTVKPEDLMRWCVRLVTPVGGLVLDPFAGSGSTGKAAVLEGMRFIGCELTAEYVPIAEARIAGAVARTAEDQAAKAEASAQADLFGQAA